MKLSSYSFLLLLSILVSCHTPAPEEVKLFDDKMIETMAVHDEVMPKMGKISQLIKALENQTDSLNVEKHKKAIADLKIGHDKMMTWMNEFGQEFSSEEINNGIQLKDVDSLKSRLGAITTSYKKAVDMKSHIERAIENAEELVKE